MAVYFTCTPSGVAAGNPGWPAHSMNIAHTPSRPAGFAAAGKIFRALSPGSEIVRNERERHGPGFRIEREKDFVSYLDETVFCHSNDNGIELTNAKKLEYVCGRSHSRFAGCGGCGCCFPGKSGENRWKLDLFRAQAYLADPLRGGKCYRGMANRCINCLNEPPVSQLLEKKLHFRLNGLKQCTADNGAEIAVTDNTVSLPPGTNLLTTESIK